MHRHLLGLALFSAIVGSAMFVSCLFYAPAMPEVAPVVPVETTYGKKTSCWKDAPRWNDGGVSNVKIRQAVFNLQSKQLESELLFEGGAATKGWVGVNLHFFKKGAGGVQYLAGENFSVVSDSKTEAARAHSVVSSFVWLDRLDSHENLYVVAERGSRFGESPAPIDFDEAAARPVLLTGKK